MSDHEILNFIQSLIDDGDGPNAIEEQLEELYDLSPSEGHKLYCQVRGLKTQTEDKRDIALASYDQKYAHTAYRMLLLGKTFNDIAEHLNVDSYTLNTWKFEIPEFSEAWAKAIDADLQVVETMLKVALGYDIVEEKVFCSQGEVIPAYINKSIAPNLKALETWLKVKHPGYWKDVQHVETNNNHTIKDMTDEELKETLKKYGVENVKSSLSSLPAIPKGEG